VYSNAVYVLKRKRGKGDRTSVEKNQGQGQPSSERDDIAVNPKKELPGLAGTLNRKKKRSWNPKAEKSTHTANPKF